jgi:hypothetical protein
MNGLRLAVEPGGFSELKENLFPEIVKMLLKFISQVLWLQKW